MDLRDYFAAHADIPWSEVREMMLLQGITYPTIQQLVDYRAACKYCEADAMMEARKK